jgi:hypothetical protein
MPTDPQVATGRAGSSLYEKACAGRLAARGGGGRRALACASSVKTELFVLSIMGPCFVVFVCHV